MIDTTKSNMVRYFVDPNLTSKIMLCFNSLRIPACRLQKNLVDPILLAAMSKERHERVVWITGDHQARTLHKDDIVASGVSVAWVYANHANQATQVFLALGFVLSAGAAISDSERPMYFEVKPANEADCHAVRVRQRIL